MSGKYDRLFLEFCCEVDSALCENVTGLSLAVRVTENIDDTDKRTIKEGFTRDKPHSTFNEFGCSFMGINTVYVRLLLEVCQRTKRY